MTVDGRSERALAKREERRRGILDASRRIFAQRGYHKTKVSDILRECGIARGTFYLYFDSKENVFRELLDELLTELRSSIAGVNTSDDAPPFEAQLTQIVHRILHKVVENRSLTTIVLREAVGLDQEVDARLQRFYRGIHEYLVYSLNNGKKLGLLRPAVDVDVAASCIVGSIRQVIEQVVISSPDEDPDVDALAQGLLDFNLRGLLPR